MTNGSSNLDITHTRVYDHRDLVINRKYILKIENEHYEPGTYAVNETKTVLDATYVYDE